jgi:hypothetical protein
MAAGSTYEPIATTTLGSAQSTVDFTSISSAYTDIILIGNVGISVSGESSLYRVGNGSFDTGTNYSSTILGGDGSSASSARTSAANGARVTWTVAFDTSITSNVIINFQNYANTSTYKTSIGRANSATGTYPATEAIVSLWRSTSAINQIRLYLTGGNYLSGSTFTLYGISAA